MRKAMHFFSKSQFRSMMMLGLVGISNITAVQADGPGKVQDGLQVSDSDWPWWRGPHRNGEAASNQSPPVAWDDSTNVAWKTAIPGRGYGSVCLHGDKAFLLTSDESSGSQSVLCLDRQTGKVLWTKVVHAQGGMRKNAKSTSASSTPACDGSNIFVCFRIKMDFGLAHSISQAPSYGKRRSVLMSNTKDLVPLRHFTNR